MENIQKKYLSQFSKDLTNPKSELVIRYAKFIYDNLEKFNINKDYIMDLHKNHSLNVEMIDDFKYDEFRINLAGDEEALENADGPKDKNASPTGKKEAYNKQQ